MVFSEIIMGTKITVYSVYLVYPMRTFFECIHPFSISSHSFMVSINGLYGSLVTLKLVSMAENALFRRFFGGKNILAKDLLDVVRDYKLFHPHDYEKVQESKKEQP